MMILRVVDLEIIKHTTMNHIESNKNLDKIGEDLFYRPYLYSFVMSELLFEHQEYKFPLNKHETKDKSFASFILCRKKSGC